MSRSASRRPSVHHFVESFVKSFVTFPLLPRTARFILSAALIAASFLGGATARAQKPMADSVEAARAASTVTRFIAASIRPKGLANEDVVALTTGDFDGKMLPQVGRRPFTSGPEYRVRSVRSIADGDSLAIVAVTSVVDTLPVFGPLAAEMTFFVRRDSAGWRISDMRRFGRFEARAAEIRAVDSSTAYPRAIKPAIVREYSSVLLSNDQLRANLEARRARFDDLVARFGGRDSLRLLGRVDHSVTQLNRVGIQWGEAAQEIPKEAVDEYMASATPKQQLQMREQLKHVARMRQAGRDSLSKYARKYGIAVSRIDSTIELMYDLDVSFVNAQLPWKGAVQLTVGGVLDDAIGYLYTPSGEKPLISADEYYYLEDLGGGWWIFRAG
jgi:hypothetical protein